MPFFQTFSSVFIRCLPAMSSFSQRCPQVSLAFPSLPFIFSSIVIVFQHVPLFSSVRNSSPRLPRHHSPSPCKLSGSEPQRTLLLNCKLSCSEPQWTLLSVELRILSFLNMLASMFLVFSKLCLASIIAWFFSNLFLRSYGFSRGSFLQFPHFRNGFLELLGFSKFAIHLFLPFNFFFTIFLHVPLFSLLFLTIFQPIHHPCKIGKKTGRFDWPHDWPGGPRAYDRDHPDHPGQSPMLIRPIRFWFLMLIFHADLAKENLIWQEKSHHPHGTAATQKSHIREEKSSWHSLFHL